MPHIVDRIQLLCKKKGISRYQLSKDADIDQSTLSRMFSNRSKPSVKNINKLSTYFQVSKEWLLTGKEYTTKNNLPTIEEPKENYKSIPFVGTEVFATISPAMSDVIALEPDTFIRIPMFSRGEFAIQVTGHSMKGFINHGDWAVIRRLYNVDKIIYGECYLIVTKEDNLRTVKFLNPHEDEDKLWLSPYNKEQFTGQFILKDDILELYQVIGIFRRVGS